MDKAQKIDKLLKETMLKLIENSINGKVILVDYANAYNKIWRNDE